jgi:membrane protein
VKPKPHAGYGVLLKQRFLSFSMTLVIAFLLLVSLIASAALSAFGAFASRRLPGGEVIWQGLNLAIPFVLISALFAAIFKILPDVKLTWKDVRRGGVITALLFSVGKFLIGYYLGHGAAISTYNVAGAIVIILIWAYYSSALLFLGVRNCCLKT